MWGRVGRPPLLRAAAAPALVVMLAAGAAPPRADEPPASTTAETLARQNAQLERQIALAESEVFYLLLAAEARELRLMYGGATLQVFPIRTLAASAPRVAFVGVGGDDDWRDAVWTAGRLVPARVEHRIEVEAPARRADDTPPPLPVPPVAEEAIPVPTRYRIRFDGGRALDIRDSGERETGTWTRRLAGRWDDTWAALASTRDTFRLDVALARADAETLYRALPPDVRLLVAPEP